jgi:hypothetical protein
VPGNGGTGSVHEQSRSYSIPRAGTVVGAGAHLHDGGINAILRNGAGTVLCDSVAQYHSTTAYPEPHLAAITPCMNIAAPVAQNERLTLTSRYENDQAIPDAMGMMLTYIAH